MAEAKVAQAEHQAHLKVEFERATAAHASALAAWQEERQSPVGLQRRGQRRRMLGHLASSGGWMAVLLVVAVV